MQKNMHARVSVGDHTFEARNCTAAWAAVHQGATNNNRGLHGPRLFGLAHPQVLGLLQQLPNASRCEGYKGWHGRAPDVPPMVRALRYCAGSSAPRNDGGLVHQMILAQPVAKTSGLFPAAAYQLILPCTAKHFTTAFIHVSTDGNSAGSSKLHRQAEYYKKIVSILACKRPLSTAVPNQNCQDQQEIETVAADTESPKYYYEFGIVKDENDLKIQDRASQCLAKRCVPVAAAYVQMLANLLPLRRTLRD